MAGTGRGSNPLFKAGSVMLTCMRSDRREPPADSRRRQQQKAETLMPDGYREYNLTNAHVDLTNLTEAEMWRYRFTVKKLREEVTSK